MDLTSMPRPSRLAGCLALVALAVTTTSGCEGFLTDTPLGVTTTARVVAPGDPVTGDVIHPDGHMTVTLSPASTPHVEGRHSAGAVPCSYRRWHKTFSCSTDDLPEGLYTVQVTDGAQPGEGTALSQVAVTDAPGYDPRIRRVDPGAEAAVGEPAHLRLTGWRPGVEVRLTMLRDYATTYEKVTLTPDADGTVTWTTKPLEGGYYTIDGGDGLWRFGGTYGPRNGAYVEFHTVGAT